MLRIRTGFAFITILLILTGSPVKAADISRQSLEEVEVPAKEREDSARKGLAKGPRSQMFEDRVYAVHITKFFPEQGFIRAVSQNRGRFAATVHFSLGEPVVDHPWGNWSNKPYAVVMPVRQLRDQILNLLPQDTFVLGDVKISKEAVVFVPSNEPLPTGVSFRVIQYKAEDGVKSAINQFLDEVDSIRFTTRKFTDKTRLGKAELSENHRLQRIFQTLFQDKPYLTQTTHEYTSWGKVDYAIIDLLASWMEKLGPVKPKGLTTQLNIYQIHDALYAFSRVVPQMKLPEHARKSHSLNMQELKSYFNLLEVERGLRLQGSSMLELDSSKHPEILSEILSRRYDRRELSDYVQSIKSILPKATPEVSEGPDHYLHYMKSTPLAIFSKRLKEDFSKAPLTSRKRVPAVTALLAVAQLKAGLITAEQALPYFKKNAKALTEGDMHRGVGSLVYEAISKDFRHNPPLNRETLRFLATPEVHRFMTEREAFKYFDEAQLREYEQTLLMNKFKTREDRKNEAPTTPSLV